MDPRNAIQTTAQDDVDVSDLVQAMSLLVRRFRTIGGSNELSWTETIILKHLHNDGPATAAELAREVGVKPQTMGMAVAALETAGLVERKPHPTDGRRMAIALTGKGLAERKQVRDAKCAWLTAAVARLDERDRQTLLASAAIIQRVVGE